MSTVFRALVGAYIALAAVAALVLLVSAAVERVRGWWRNRKFPWFPPPGHPDAGFELSDGERDVFASLMVRAEGL